MPALGDDFKALLGYASVKTAKEGFFMGVGVHDSGRRGSSGFRQVVSVFLTQPGLPFASILSAERIEQVFAKHGNLFGVRGVYSTALCEPQGSTIMVWSFLSQVLSDGKEASCQAAVAKVVNYCQLGGQKPPTADTGDYCKARAKLSEEALHDLSREVAAEFTKEDIAQLYGFRWNTELDIRCIKDSLNLAHVRCKSPTAPGVSNPEC